MSRIFVLDERGNYINQLTQWDLNREIVIKDFEYNTSPVFHFCNQSSDESIVVNGELNNNTISVKIPNILLENTIPILVYVCLCDNEKNIVATINHFEIPIRKRAKPKDYVYVQNTDYIRISDLKDELETFIDNSKKALDNISLEIGTLTSNATQVICNANEATAKANTAAQSAIEIKNTIENALNNGDFNSTTDYLELEHKPSINSVEIIGDISLADIKAQQALHRGKLKDIVVIKTMEEYDALFADEGYLARMTESMQEDDYILLVIIEVVFSADVPTTMFTTLSKKNGELVMENGFASTVIDDKIFEAVENLRNWTKERLEADKPIIYTGTAISFVLGHNTEYRKNSICTDLQLRLPSNVPDDYISSLVFNSGNKATTLSYPQTILFTGDDVIDNVFVPAANTTYNVMFWYDGINVNAVSRGVPYAQE